MKDKYIIGMNNTVKSTIEKMEKEKIKAVVILDEDEKVVGLFSNGDMRTFFLRGGELSSSICDAMNKNPKLYRSIEEIEEERITTIRVLYPIIDENNKIKDILDYDFLDKEEKIKQISLWLLWRGEEVQDYIHIPKYYLSH